MNVLVLGGNGFLGSHIVEELLKLQHVVTIYDIKDNVLFHDVKFIRGSITDTVNLSEALEKQDLIYYCIGSTNPVLSWDNPSREIHDNILPMLTLLSLCVKKNIRKIVYPSSGGTVYGKFYGSATENTLPNPYTPYGIGKMTVEYFLEYYREKNSLQYDIYRISNMYGIRQNIYNKQGVISVWMHNIIENKPIVIYGSGKEERDYIYVKDAASLMMYSLRNFNSDMFNLGTGQGVSLLTLLDLFRRIIDEKFTYEFMQKRDSDCTCSIVKSNKILSHFGDFQFSNLEDKIKEMWTYIRNDCHV